MIDDLRSDDGLDGSHIPKRRVPDAQRPLTDREVPLGQLETESRVLAAPVHAWLDGDLPEASVRRGTTAKEVAFWNQINAEAERRRQTLTPVHLEARIMEAIPRTAPQVITPWWRREVVVTPGAAASAIVLAVVLSSAVTALVLAALR